MSLFFKLIELYTRKGEFHCMLQDNEPAPPKNNSQVWVTLSKLPDLSVPFSSVNWR